MRLVAELTAVTVTTPTTPTPVTTSPTSMTVLLAIVRLLSLVKPPPFSAAEVEILFILGAAEGSTGPEAAPFHVAPQVYVSELLSVTGSRVTEPSPNSNPVRLTMVSSTSKQSIKVCWANVFSQDLASVTVRV